MDYCGNCGGNNLIIVGGNSATPRYQCNDCGSWGRTRYMLNSKNETLLGNCIS